jgi:arabinogalactan endo-1,4-beta-galactosidase
VLDARVGPLAFLASLAVTAPLASVLLAEPMVGCYPCDSLVQRYWHDVDSGWSDRSSIELLREHGFGWMRFGITTQSHAELSATGDWSALPWQGGYWSCREVGQRALSEAAAAGMKLDLMLFLSDTAAHGGRQEPPAAWRGHDVPQTCRDLEAYCFETGGYFKSRGLDIDLYEVGNEIERGICGFRPDERIARPPDVNQLTDIGWMRANIWTPEALMLTAAIRGIRRADPDAKIVLHAATRPAPEDGLVVAFFEAMAQAGVPFDYAGLSFYPWSGYPSAPPREDWRAQLGNWVAGIALCGKPVLICEFSYPHHPVSPEPGSVAAALPGFPFSPEGQAAWVRDFLGWCRTNPHVARSFYLYPDYIWRVQEPGARTEGLFLSEGGQVSPAPALLEFRRASPEHER